jgi:hypothetical protein
MGNVKLGRRQEGFFATAAVSASFALGLVLEAQARNQLTDQRARDRSETGAHFREGRMYRRSSRIAFSLGSGIWIYDAVTASLAAKRRNREIENDRF